MTPEIVTRLRQIRPVHEWLADPAIEPYLQRYGRETTKSLIQTLLDELRASIRAGEAVISKSDFVSTVAVRLEAEHGLPIQRVINTTGILIHTGLGRSPLSQLAIDAISSTVSGYCNLEFDLETGKRGSRSSLISQKIARLTGAEAATVVNNNAAATILALKAMAFGREVIVSRGQLVEIGGSFRLPEIMELSGAMMREVGTTNKTHLSDYARAINEKTAAILRVHTSNYEVVGFSSTPSAGELGELARVSGVLFIDDIGSGALSADAVPCGRNDPSVEESLRAGADLILFSGDKLLGGPQCGILAGKQSVISQLEKDPMMRAFRVDKLTLAALSATLSSWVSPERRDRELPLWRYLSESLETVRLRAESLAGGLRQRGWNVETSPSDAFTGGGSLPVEKIKSYAVVIRNPWQNGVRSESHLSEQLRRVRPPVIGRLHEGAFWMDLRAVSDAEVVLILKSFDELQAI